MTAIAITRNVRVSPYKLRLYADAIRGKMVSAAYHWLQVHGIKRTDMLVKTLHSAYSNARQKDQTINDMAQVRIAEIRVDQGPQIKYFKPGAQGRTSPQRKRLSHITIIVQKSL